MRDSLSPIEYQWVSEIEAREEKTSWIRELGQEVRRSLRELVNDLVVFYRSADRERSMA